MNLHILKGRTIGWKARVVFIVLLLSTGLILSAWDGIFPALQDIELACDEKAAKDMTFDEKKSILNVRYPVRTEEPDHGVPAGFWFEVGVKKE